MFATSTRTRGAPKPIPPKYSPRYGVVPIVRVLSVRRRTSAGSTAPDRTAGPHLRDQRGDHRIERATVGARDRPLPLVRSTDLDHVLDVGELRDTPEILRDGLEHAQ